MGAGTWRGRYCACGRRCRGVRCGACAQDGARQAARTYEPPGRKAVEDISDEAIEAIFQAAKAQQRYRRTA